MENETADEIQKTADNLYCSLDEALVEEVKQFLILLAAFNIILSLVAFLGNTLILDALRKESSIRPPFGPQKVEKKLKKSEKGTKAFAFEIRCSISPYTKKDFHLSKREICEFYKKHFIIEF